MYSFFCVFIVFLFCTYSLAGELGCKFRNPVKRQETLDKLTSVLDSGLKRLSVTDEKGFKYDIGFCVNALEGQDAGVMQTDTSKATGAQKVIGRYEEADLTGGTEWLALTYSGGEKYVHHCGQEPRQAMIMLVCNPGEEHGVARIIEENNSKMNNCYYLFEVGHQAVCEDMTLYGSTGLSPGSIICIVFLSIAAVYLGGGFLYQRLVAGAKGLEQMPHFSFWQDFGNLIADGCDLVFRCGSSTSDSRQYRGLGDDQLQTAAMESEDETDEHLLPM